MKKIITTLLALSILAVFAGCAAQRAFREGQSLIQQGKMEDGLKRLEFALSEDPRNFEYRATYLQNRERATRSLLEQAEKGVVEGRSTEAEALFRRVLAIDSANPRAKSGLQLLEMEKRHKTLFAEAEAAWKKQDSETALLRARSILAENPNHDAARALQKTIQEKMAKPPGQEIKLTDALKKTLTIEFKETPLKQVFEVLARTSGLNFIFDKDVKTDQKTTVFLRNTTVKDAVDRLLLTNQLEQRVLDSSSILIYPNTPQKLKDYQPLMVRSFFLANADVKQAANTLKTILKIRDLVTDEKLNMIIIRDTPEAIRLAEKLMVLQDLPEPEVMLEVEILEIKRSRLMELGIKYPDQLSLTPLATSGTTLTLTDLKNLNSDRLGATISPLVINARKVDSDGNILANPRIRARNHEKAKILIGDRVPNITTTSTSTGFVSDSVQYIEVGLKLDVEPTIYLDNEIAIKIALEVSNIVSQIQTKSGSIAFQIGTRTASTVLRLRDGENQVLAGLINDEDRRTANKVPGLGDIPIAGRLFSSQLDDNAKTEIVLSITPRLIRNTQRPDLIAAEFDSGTESSLRSIATSGPGTQSIGPVGTPGAADPSAVARTPVAPPPRGVSPGSTGPVFDMGSAAAGTTPGTATVAGGAPSSGSQTTQLTWQGPQQLNAGGTFALQLNMLSDQALTSVPFSIGYDAKALEVINVAEGDFLKKGGAGTSFNNRVDQGSGQIFITSTSAASQGVAGSGSLVTITMRALTSTPETRIQLLTISPIGVNGRAIQAPLPLPQTIAINP